MVISAYAAMDTTLMPPQLRVKTSFSIEHILSKPEKSTAGDCRKRCNKSVGETEHDHHFGYSNSDSVGSEQERSSCKIVLNTDQRSDHSNDGVLHCETPDSSSDVASEESNCKLRLSFSHC